MVDQSFAVATHALVMMAFSKGQVSATAIAEELHLSPVVVRRTMTRLVKAGFCSSTAGPSGGYTLLRDDASLLDILRAVHENEEVISSRFDIPTSTCDEGLMVDALVAEIYQDADSAVAAIFSKWTIKRIRATTLKRLD